MMIIHLVPERALPGPVVWGEADVVAGHHGAALEVPVGHSEPRTLNSSIMRNF